MARSIRKNAALMMAGTLLSRAFGLVRQAVFNNLYPDLAKDAFNVAFRVPNLFREILAEGAVTNALIPVLKGLEGEARRAFVRRFFAFLLAANLAVLGLIELSAPFFADLLVARGSALDLGLVTLLIQVVAPFLLAISISALFSALLQAEERFFAPAFAPVAFNLAAVGLMLAFPKAAPWIAVAFVAGGFAQAAVQLPFLKGVGIEFKFAPEVRRAGVLMLPFLFSTSTRQVVNVVLTALLTAYPTAAVTGFYNAEMVYLMLLGLLSVSPAMAVFPRLAEHAAKGEVGAFRGLLARALVQVGLLLALASALAWALAPWIVAVLFAWTPAFTPANFRFSTEALLALSLAVFPWGLYALLLRAYYARERVFEAVRVSVALFLLNALGYYLLAPFGMFRLNLATVLAGWLGVFLLALGLARGAWLDLGELSRRFLPVLAAALLAAGVARLFAGVAGPPAGAIASLLPLGFGGAGGLLAYLFALRAARAL
ncbi:MAG TPA: murein biosynthesis integral membrane protein MurJ [Oceanithermus sp.]|nr:murein biosynthesis integral membrane protein MurJ [Oceanithermus sp.]